MVSSPDESYGLDCTSALPFCLVREPVANPAAKDNVRNNTTEAPTVVQQMFQKEFNRLRLHS
jgi:hypothetical protein